MKKCIVLLVLLLPVVVRAGFTEGVEYLKLDSPQPTADADRIEVLEAFWYGCPHCYRFEPDLEAWLKKKPDDVAFVRLPAVFHPDWELQARAFYTAQAMGVLDKVHHEFFHQIHELREPVRSLGDVKRIFLAAGVSGHEFDRVYHSFLVVTQANRARQAGDLYGLKGVPTMVVNGKYRTTAKLAGGNRKMLEVVDFLVERERQARKARQDGRRRAKATAVSAQ